MKINWKNVLDRVLWTFAEGFLSGLALEQIFAISETCQTKSAVVMVLTGAIASGVSAVKTMILEIAAAKRGIKPLQNADKESTDEND